MRRAHRLRANEDFRRVRRTGRSWAHPLLVLYAAPGTTPDTRIGISVSKRVGGAAVRNKVKRRIREAARDRVAGLEPGWDVVFIARKPASAAEYGDIEEAVRVLLARAGIERAGACRASHSG